MNFMDKKTKKKLEVARKKLENLRKQLTFDSQWQQRNCSSDQTTKYSCNGAYKLVLPSDGTDILKDAEYFVFCKVSGFDDL